ncbi:hypothetical protein ACFE04_016064 [Oxalis oulophora]
MGLFKFFVIILQSMIEEGKMRCPESFPERLRNRLSNYVSLRTPSGGPGWVDFATHHSLAFRHFLVFDCKHVDLFEVIICDQSGVEISYPAADSPNPSDDEEPYWIQLPKAYLIKPQGDPMSQIFKETYPHFCDNYSNYAYLKEQIMVSPLNDTVHCLNDLALSQIPGESSTYFSCDTAIEGDARLSTTSGTMMLMNEEIDVFHQSDITINDKRIELGTQLKRAIPMTLQSLLTQYDELRQGQTYICTTDVVGIDDGYRVKLDVVDGESSAFFLLFESADRSVFGQLGYKMREKYDPSSVPQAMKSIIVGKAKIFYVVLNSIELQGDKRTFVVSHLEDVDEATSSGHGSSKITTPTKGAEVYNPSDFITPSKPSSSQFPSQTPGIDTPYQEHHSTISETPTGVKESAISLDDILEDGLQMPQRKVKRPLVFESDDEHDEQQSKKLTRLRQDEYLPVLRHHTQQHCGAGPIKELSDELGDYVTIISRVGMSSIVIVEKSNDEPVYLGGDGWAEFAAYHSLSFGHFLLFKCKRPYYFKVFIFDQTATKIDYPTPDFDSQSSNVHSKFDKRMTASDITGRQTIGIPLPFIRENWSWFRCCHEKCYIVVHAERSEKSAFHGIFVKVGGKEPYALGVGNLL